MSLLAFVIGRLLPFATLRSSASRSASIHGPRTGSSVSEWQQLMGVAVDRSRLVYTVCDPPTTSRDAPHRVICTLYNSQHHQACLKHLQVPHGNPTREFTYLLSVPEFGMVWISSSIKDLGSGLPSFPLEGQKTRIPFSSLFPSLSHTLPLLFPSLRSSTNDEPPVALPRYLRNLRSRGRRALSRRVEQQTRPRIDWDSSIGHQSDSQVHQGRSVPQE